MRRSWGGWFLLIIGCSFVYSNELVSDLYQKNDLLHLNLLRNSVFFDQQQDDYELNILENYYIGNYSQFIKDFQKKYSNYRDADNQMIFFYLASKYRLADYASLTGIIDFINPELLSLDNWRDLQKIKAVSYYMESKESALNGLLGQLKTDDRSNKNLLDSVNNLYQLQLAGRGEITGSSDVDINYYVAWTKLKAGKYDEAISFFDKAMKAEYVPIARKEFINYGVGITHYASGNKEEALKQLSIGYSNTELKESALFFQLLMAFDDKKFGEVVSASSEFLATQPNTVYQNQVKYLYGASLYSLGSEQQAKKVLEEVKDFSQFVKYLLAEIYYNEGSYAKAKTYYKETYDKASEPLSIYAGYGFAWSCFKSSQYKEAENMYEKLILNKTLSEELRFNVMMKSADSNYNSGSYKDAEKKYKDLLNKLEGNTDKYNALYKQGIYNLAKVYMKLKDFTKANDLLNKYLVDVRNDKETVIIKTIIANNNYQLKNYSVATKIYEEILLVWKDYKNEDIYISLADSYFNAKEYAKALVVYQDYLKEYVQGERDMDARYGMVQTLYQLKKFDEARAQAKYVDDKYGIGLLAELEGKIKFGKETVSE